MRRPCLREDDLRPEVSVLEVARRLASAERRRSRNASVRRGRPDYAPDEADRLLREELVAFERASALELIVVKCLTDRKILQIRRGGR